MGMFILMNYFMNQSNTDLKKDYLKVEPMKVLGNLKCMTKKYVIDYTK